MERVKKYSYYIFLVLILAFGIILRTKFYLERGIFEDDECRLVYSMLSKTPLDMFKPLGPWSSTPIFMFVSKIIADLTDFNEYALEFIPYVCSIGSVFLFFKLSEKLFFRKPVILIANYFFAVNVELLYFSTTFKQYSLELLVGLFFLYFYDKINLSKMNYKQVAILGIIFAVIPLASLSSLFFIGAFILINLFQYIKNKDVLKKLLIIILPFLISMAFYYVYNLAPTKTMQMINYGSIWREFYSDSIQTVIYKIFRELFRPNQYLLFMMMLAVTSIILILVEKIRKTTIDIYAVCVIFLVILASMLHILPFLSRASIHVVPILIFLFLKPIDVLNVKKLIFYVFVVFTVNGFYSYFSPSFIKYVYNISDNMINFSPDNLIKDIKKDYSEKTDKIIVNEGSLFSFICYTQKNDFTVTQNNLILPQLDKGNIKGSVYEYLDNLDPNYNYWFYLIKEYQNLDRYYMRKWVKNQNIKRYKHEKDSYLYYIVPPYNKVQP